MVVHCYSSMLKTFIQFPPTRMVNGAIAFGILLLAGPAVAALPEILLKERWFTDNRPAENVDSIGFWQDSESGMQWIIVTAKSSHSLLVHDAENGDLVRRVGGQGPFDGQFDRPNGVKVWGDFVFVVERDNRRVQVLSLPDFHPVASFGSEELIKPYGLAITALPADPAEPGVQLLHVYVTDNYEYADGALTADGDIPPDSLLGERVKVYRVEVEGPAVEGEFAYSFGDTRGPGILRVVESIWLDPEHNRALICEEFMGVDGQQVLVYDLQGNFTGETIASHHFAGQPEGIALYEDGPQDGFWIITDQGKSQNHFVLFDRRSLAPLARVTGLRTLNTDGIFLVSAPVGRYAGGLFYAVDNDARVSAFDFAELRKAVEQAVGR